MRINLIIIFPVTKDIMIILFVGKIIYKIEKNEICAKIQDNNKSFEAKAKVSDIKETIKNDYNEYNENNNQENDEICIDVRYNTFFLNWENIYMKIILLGPPLGVGKKSLKCKINKRKCDKSFPLKRRKIERYNDSKNKSILTPDYENIGLNPLNSEILEYSIICYYILLLI